MPQEVEDCVDALMEDPDFKPRKKGQSKRSAAYAVCTAQYQKQHGKALTEGGYTIEHCICPACGHEQRAKADVSCRDTKCPECNQPMIAKERKSLPMRITKAALRDGRMYWQGEVSDTEWDMQDERMALSLFDDFQRHLHDQRQKAATELPYVSLAHYQKLPDGRGDLGAVEDIWSRFNVATAEGHFHDNRLGRRCFEVVQDELQRIRAGEEIEDPVRFSIAFYPHGVAEEDGRRVFLQGELDHIALTRIPVNPRTRFTYVEEKAMAIKTKKGDGLSIVGEDFLDDVEELERSAKSLADDDLIIKSDDDPEDSSLTGEQEIILRAMLQEQGCDEEEIEEKAWTYGQKKALPDSAYAYVETGPGCEKKDGKRPQKCRHLPYKSSGGAVDCAHVRAALQAIGGARTGKPMKGVPSSAKQKLRRALAGCQRKKSDILDSELEDMLEQARIEGFNLALDMDAPEDVEEPKMTEKKEEKASPDLLEEITKAMNPPEEKEEEPVVVDRVDEYSNLLKQIPTAEGSRARKMEAAEGVLRSLAAYVAGEIDKTTPASPEDVARSMKAEFAELLQPMMDKIAALEAMQVEAKSEAPASKALKGESFYISPEESIRKAQGDDKPMSQAKRLARESVGLPVDQL